MTRQHALLAAALTLGLAAAYLAGTRHGDGDPAPPDTPPLAELAADMIPAGRITPPARQRLADMLDALADITERNPDTVATWGRFRDLHHLAGRLAFHDWPDRPADPAVAAALDNYLAAALDLELGNIPADEHITTDQRRRLMEALTAAAYTLRQ